MKKKTDGMVCPNCKAEYREGYKECEDCKVALVDKPDDPVEPRENRFSINEASEILRVLNSRVKWISRIQALSAIF